MNLKTVVGKIVRRLWPELESKTHLPLLAVVIAVPDPPANGENYSDERPRFAVDLRLLKPDKAIDEDMPLLRDIPVALPAAAPGRGFAALPQPGTIVELAFAFGNQSMPFVRSVLPDGLKLPAIEAAAQRWQQNDQSYQEVDEQGNWRRNTNKKILDSATEEFAVKSPQCWFGSDSENSLVISSQFMASVIAALQTIANHTHASGSPVDQKDSINSKAQEVTGQKIRLDSITKT